MFPAMSENIELVALPGAMRNLLEVVLSINISSLQDEEAAPGKLCQKNKQLQTFYTQSTEDAQRVNNEE